MNCKDIFSKYLSVEVSTRWRTSAEPNKKDLGVGSSLSLRPGVGGLRQLLRALKIENRCWPRRFRVDGLLSETLRFRDGVGLGSF